MAERKTKYEQNYSGKKDVLITPDFLGSESQIEELYIRLKQTQSGSTFLQENSNLPHSRRGTRLAISKWQTYIPIIHHILGDTTNPDMTFRRKFLAEKTDISKYSVPQTALYQLSTLITLINMNKLSEKEIQESFPAYSPQALAPYQEVLMDAEGQSLFDIWQRFREHPNLTSLISEENKWILKEFPEIAYSTEIQEKLNLRNSPEVYDAGCMLIPHILSEDVKPHTNVYFELGTIFNWNSLSPNDTRVQIAAQFDQASSYFLDKYGHFVEFTNLKTRLHTLDYPNKFQALLTHFLAGHFMDEVMQYGICPQKHVSSEDSPNESWYKTKCRNLSPVSKNYSFAYKIFDIKTGTLSEIPVQADYQTDKGRLFLKWLGFYSDALNALRTQIDQYVRFGTLPQQDSKVYVQEHFSSLQREKKEVTKKPKTNEKMYIIGESVSDEKCPKCDSPMTQICLPVRDLHGQKLAVSIEIYCQNHYRNIEKLVIERRLLEYQDQGTK